jgi:DHA1 family multidrug resistance protein-like MFS transporter
MWWTQLFAVSGMGLILPFLPLLVRSLGVADSGSVQRWSGSIFSAPFLFAALMTPVWGWLGDRFGRKRMVMRALLGLALALALMSFATTPLQLLVLRALQGAVSGFIPAAIALVSAAAPRERQGYALGTLTSAQAAGIVMGPLVGGVLADLVGFRTLFYITASVELLAALVVLRFVHEPRRDTSRPGFASLRENVRFASRGPIPVTLVGLFLTQLSLLIVLPFFALFVESLGVAPERLSTTTGVLFGITGAAMSLSAPIWGRISDRHGRRRTILLAVSAGSVTLFLQGLVSEVRWLFLLRTLQGVLAAGMLPSLYSVIAHYTPEARRSGIMAFGSSATLLGGLVGPLSGGYLASVLGMRLVFFAAAGLLAMNGLNALRLPPDHEPREVHARRSWELPTQ